MAFNGASLRLPIICYGQPWYHSCLVDIVEQVLWGESASSS